MISLYEPHHEKTCFQGYKDTNRIQKMARGLNSVFRKYRDHYSICIEKNEKKTVSHDAAHTTITGV